MIHRKSRDELALALRRYAAGLITNDDLDGVSVDWRDRGSMEVQHNAWFLYDDNYTHKACGRHELSKSTKRQIAQWILFLHSDKEYIWPELKSIPALDCILSFLTLGYWGKLKRQELKEFHGCGDIESWPFISADELADARANPVLLCG